MQNYFYFASNCSSVKILASLYRDKLLLQLLIVLMIHFSFFFKHETPNVPVVKKKLQC